MSAYQRQTPFFRMPQAASRGESSAASSQQQLQLSRVQQYHNKPHQLLKSQQKQQQQQQQGQQSEVDQLSYAPALTKLKLEADKIRKWRTASQLELRRKEGQLQEAVRQVQSQQEGLTQLKVENEGLKTRLEEEATLQRELSQKVMVTRGLCSTLRERLDRTDQVLAQGTSDHTHNMDINTQRLEQFKMLALKFTVLEDEQTRVQRSLEEALKLERQRHSQTLVKCNALNDDLSATRDEVRCLQETLAQTRRSRDSEEEMRRAVEETASSLQQQLQSTETQSVCLQTKVSSLQEELVSISAQHSSSLSSLHAELAVEGNRRRELSDMCSMKDTTIEDLKSQLTSSTTNLTTLTEHTHTLKKELETAEREKEEAVTELATQLKSLEEQYSLTTATLQQKIDSQQRTITSQHTQLLEDQTMKSVRESEMDQFSNQLTEKEELCKALQAHGEKLVQTLDHASRQIEEERKERRREKEEVEEEREKKGKEREELETTMQELRHKVITLTHQSEDRQKSEGDKITQLLSEKALLERTANDLRQTVDSTSQLLEEERDTAKCHLEEAYKEHQQQLQKCRADVEAAQTSQAQDKITFDAQMTELCGMLEKYRTENERIVSQKDIQINTLQASLLELQKTKESIEDIGHLNFKEVDRLNELLREQEVSLREKEREMEEGEKERREREREVEEIRERVAKEEEERRRREEGMREEVREAVREELREEMREKVREKEAEIKELLKAVECLKERPRSYTPHYSTSTPHPSHSTPHLSPLQDSNLHTPQRPTTSSMVPRTAPVHPPHHTTASLYSHPPRHLPTSHTLTRSSSSSHTLTSSQADSTRAPKRLRQIKHYEEEEEEEEEEVSEEVLASEKMSSRTGGSYGVEGSHSQSVSEQVFRRPQTVPNSVTHSSSSSSSTRDSSSKMYSNSTSRITHTPSRYKQRGGGRGGGGRGGGGRGGGVRGRMSVRDRKKGGGQGEKKQAGTAWFDLDSVFGFGPED